MKRCLYKEPTKEVVTYLLRCCLSVNNFRLSSQRNTRQALFPYTNREEKMKNTRPSLQLAPTWSRSHNSCWLHRRQSRAHHEPCNSQCVHQRYHSLTNVHANNLLGAHHLGTRLRAGNSSVNLYFGHEFKLNLFVIRHKFVVDSLIVRHEFTKTHLWLGMSLQKLSFY